VGNENMTGIFDLRNAPDLLKKLQHEYRQLEAAPGNAYIAFNFFVTAEHMLDWLYPKKAGEPKRKQTREGELLLQICSHLANGAKHFEVEAKQHQSVAGSLATGGLFPDGFFPPGLFPKGYFPEKRLIVNLKGRPAAAFGQSITALSLARQVLSYWENHPDLKAH